MDKKKLQKKYVKAVDAVSDLKSACEEYVLERLKEGEHAYYCLEDDDRYCITYDGGNHPEYASNAYSEIQSVFVKNGKICFEIEEDYEYEADRTFGNEFEGFIVNSFDTMVRPGSKIIWDDREMADACGVDSHREMTVFKTYPDHVCVNDKNSEAEVPFSAICEVIND